MGTMTADKKPDGESLGRESMKPESMKKKTDIGPTSIDGSGSGFGKSGVGANRPADQS